MEYYTPPYFHDIIQFNHNKILNVFHHMSDPNRTEEVLLYNMCV